MAATMDFYSSRPLQSELMEALEPFMKSASPSSSSTITTLSPPSSSTSPPSTSSPSYNCFSFFPSIQAPKPRLVMVAQHRRSKCFPTVFDPSPFGFRAATGLNRAEPTNPIPDPGPDLPDPSPTHNHHQQQQHHSLSFLGPRAVPMKQMCSPPKPTKLYIGVRQRHLGKWVAEIRSRG